MNQPNPIPFDLTKALAGEPVITRDGQPVPELHYFKTARSHYPLIAIVDGAPQVYTKDGKVSRLRSDYPGDLFMAPKKTTLYHVTFMGHLGQVKSGVYESEKERTDGIEYLVRGAAYRVIDTFEREVFL